MTRYSVTKSVIYNNLVTTDSYEEKKNVINKIPKI